MLEKLPKTDDHWLVLCRHAFPLWVSWTYWRVQAAQ